MASGIPDAQNPEIRNWSRVLLPVYRYRGEHYFVDIPYNKVVFKLTLNTIKTFIKYYHDVYCVDDEGKEHYQRLYEDFVQAIKRYVFYMRASVFEGLEKDGAGELFCGQSQNVKNSILEFMQRLSPSPPKEVEPI